MFDLNKKVLDEAFTLLSLNTNRFLINKQLLLSCMEATKAEQKRLKQTAMVWLMQK
jgi:hypothetical protein